MISIEIIVLAISLIIELILMFTIMIFSSIAATASTNKDYERAHSNSTKAAVTAGITSLFLIVFMGLYGYYFTTVGSKLNTAISILGI